MLAGELAPALDGGGDVTAALDRYTARRRVRTRQLQAMSWTTSAALHLPDGPAARRRNESLALLPGRLAWIHGHDALSR